VPVYVVFVRLVGLEVRSEGVDISVSSSREFVWQTELNVSTYSVVTWPCLTAGEKADDRHLLTAETGRV
jgi:hypothetical protein